jgi:hypothetical protein
MVCTQIVNTSMRRACARSYEAIPVDAATRNYFAEVTGMELTRTDSVPQGDTLTAYDFAMEEVTGASSRLAHALLARTQKKADATTTEQECSNARSVYEKMIHLFPRVRLDATQRASLLKELGLLRSRLEACKADQGKSQPTRR